VLDRRVDGALHVLFLAHVAHHRDALAARGFDVGDDRVHRPGQLGVRLGRLGQQYDGRAVLGRAERDRQPNATTRVRSVNGGMGLLEGAS